MPQKQRTQRKPIENADQDSFLQRLGPGFITGASDDDPSGIGTYSQAGAQLGFGIGWTMLVTYPLMAAIQEISGRLGRVNRTRPRRQRLSELSGTRDLVAWWCCCSPRIRSTLPPISGAMGDALKLLIGGPAPIYVVGFGAVSVVAQIFFKYERYVSILKWLTLVLFAYVIALFVVKVPWSEALIGLLIPKIQWTGAFLTTLVAILGTTISPYLFVWQSSQEAEEQRIDPDKKPLKREPHKEAEETKRIRIDTLVGMAVSNVIAIAIIMTTAATLHASGKTGIESSAQAAEALKPVAGAFAEFIFALGIVGTGLLAIPCWRDRRPMPSEKVASGPSASPASRRKRSPFIPCSRCRSASAYSSTLQASTPSRHSTGAPSSTASWPPPS